MIDLLLRGAIVGAVPLLGTALVLANDVSFSPVVTFTTVFVTALCAISLAYTQRKSKAGDIYKEEAEAERRRSTRLDAEVKELQTEKDALGLELKEAQIAVAELSNRPDMRTLQTLLTDLTDAMRTQAHSGHEIGQQMLERISDHHTKMTQLHEQLVLLIGDMRDRQSRVRREDTQ